MHPEVALAMARARHEDVLRSTGPHGVAKPHPLSGAARPRRRLLPVPHLPLVSHRTRLGH